MHEVEIMSSLFAIIRANWNQLRLWSTLTLWTKEELLGECGTLVYDEENTCGIIVVSVKYLSVGVKLRLINRFCKVTRIINIVFTVIKFTVTDINHQAMLTTPLNSLSFTALKTRLTCNLFLLSWVNYQHVFVLVENRDQRTVIIPRHAPGLSFCLKVIVTFLHLNIPDSYSA